MQMQAEEGHEPAGADDAAGNAQVLSLNDDSDRDAGNPQYLINYQVELVPQPTAVSCWAAALAMVASFRDQASYTAETIASRAGMDLARPYGWNDIRSAVETWQFNEEGPTCAMPDVWAQLLQNNGPIWVVEVANPGAHAVVLTGLRGDGTPEGTHVTVQNPWPPNQGGTGEMRFVDFEQEFELGAPANAMIVHK